MPNSKPSSRRVWGQRPGQLGILSIMFGIKKRVERQEDFMKKYGVLAALLLFVLALAGCGSTSEPVKKAEQKVLRVGTEPTFPPFEFHDDKKNEYVGFDMDLIRAIGKELGYKVEIQSLGFDALIPALEAGNIDVAASGITITDERAQKVAFTRSYYDAGLTIVVPKNEEKIKDFADLDGKRIGVQIGTTGALEASRVPNATVREYNTPNEAFLEMKNGGVDAVINDRPVNEYFLKSGGSEYAKVVGKPRNAESYGFAVAKKNTELVSSIDKALDLLKKNGEYDRIYDTWFGKKAN